MNKPQQLIECKYASVQQQHWYLINFSLQDGGVLSLKLYNYFIIKKGPLFLFQRYRKGIIDGKSTVDVNAAHPTKHNRLCKV